MGRKGRGGEHVQGLEAGGGVTGGAVASEGVCLPMSQTDAASVQVSIRKNKKILDARPGKRPARLSRGHQSGF